MNPEKVDSIIKIILSLAPFVLVGVWLAVKTTKAQRANPKKPQGTKRMVEIDGQKYLAKKVQKILVTEKETGAEAIVTTCGFESDTEQASLVDGKLPKLVKVRYKQEDSVFSWQESDWLPGEQFNYVGLIEIEEYQKV
jgi:uncharacterized protein YneF (UPF0154 family)